MSGRRARALRQAAGPYVKPAKTPTPVDERSGIWQERVAEEPHRGRMRKVRQIRPSSLAKRRYGYRDLGWAVPSTYYTLGGKLRKVARPNG